MTRVSASRPWGRLVGLLTASFVTLIGVSHGLEPDIILQRAIAASLVLGLMTTVVMLLARTVGKTN